MGGSRQWKRGAAGLLEQTASAAHSAAERFASAGRVARFLQGRLQFIARPSDVFISSYPRSGTTWLQQVLVVLANDEADETHISERAPWFERRLALGIQTAADFERLPSPRIFKSHLPHLWLPKGARYVYVVRDGRDVAVSYYHLYRSHLGYRGDFDGFFERFLRGDLQYGSWFKHAAGWRRLDGRPDVHIVSYERMQSDLQAVMVELAQFCGLQRSHDRIAQLSEFCSFAYMKQHQDLFDHATEERALRGMATGQFVRRGTTGEYGDYFSPSQLTQFEQSIPASRRWHGLEFQLADFLH